MQGTVKWFNRIRGFGIIEGEDGKDYFVHYSNISREGNEYVVLYENEKVSFDEIQPPDGKERMNAANVVVLEKSQERK